MDFNKIKSRLIEWGKIDAVSHDGETGANAWKEINTDNFRIGLAEYSPNYKSAEWCEKGHTIFCVEGEITIQLKTGDKYVLTEGNSLLLGKDDHHIGITGNQGAKIFVVD